MNIYNLLSSKQHNPHYLKRYFRFIEFCKTTKNDQSSKIEEHHILPKSVDLFPEYKSFKQFPWNKIKLSLRQHYIAHYMLWKAFGGRQAQAFKLMCERSKNVSSKQYEKVKTAHSDSMKGTLNHNSTGLQSKKAWATASEERRKKQSQTMIAVNKTKRKPKEIRHFLCSHCGTPIQREIFCHKPSRPHYYCNRACIARFVAKRQTIKL